MLRLLVPAQGFEDGTRLDVDEDPKASAPPTIATTADASTNHPDREGFGPTIGPDGDVVEGSLARAIERASAAGRFDVVAQLARELEARRLSSAGVVDLAEARKRRR